MALTPSRKAELTEKITARERLTRADGEDLYDSGDLAWLGGLAQNLDEKATRLVRAQERERNIKIVQYELRETWPCEQRSARLDDLRALFVHPAECALHEVPRPAVVHILRKAVDPTCERAHEQRRVFA